jgi:hypothetical protein
LGKVIVQAFPRPISWWQEEQSASLKLCPLAAKALPGTTRKSAARSGSAPMDRKKHPFTLFTLNSPAVPYGSFLF